MTGRRDAPRRLTLAFVRRVSEPGKYYDQDGLILTVSPTGRKRWSQRITIDGRRRDTSIGSAHRVTPAQARKIAAKNREIARAGKNPLASRSNRRRTPDTAPRPMTFARFALNRYRRQVAGEVGLVRLRKDRSRIVRLVNPTLGRHPIDEIAAEDVQHVLARIAKENTNTAENVRRQLGAIFDEAVAERYRSSNPARDAAVAVPKKRKRISGEGDARNRRILEELPAFLRDLENSPRRPSLLLLFRFTLLTLRNPAECRLATWPQIDAEARLWRFPHMQREGGEPVEVELHDGLMTIVEQARLMARGDMNGWVFRNPLDINEPYSANAAYKVTREFGYEINQLDFRRAFEYWQVRDRRQYTLQDWHNELADP